MNEFEIIGLLDKKIAYWETVCSVNPTPHAKSALIDFRGVKRDINEALIKQGDAMFAAYLEEQQEASAPVHPVHQGAAQQVGMTERR